jgi:putative addiction module component (TIGR02574 family)
MARSARELFEEAMRLDPEERATLMRLLIDTLDAESDEGVEDAWRVEIQRRMVELDAGAVQAVPWEELIAVPALNGGARESDVPSNFRIQRRVLRAAADPARSAHRQQTAVHGAARQDAVADHHDRRDAVMGVKALRLEDMGLAGVVESTQTRYQVALYFPS